jgi:mycothiol synthase
MPSITSRPYANESDLLAMLDLLQRCRAAGQIVTWPTIADLREVCHPSRTDWSKQLWLDSEEKLIGFALMQQEYLCFYAHPPFQNNGLESQILAWAIERCRALELEPTEVRCQAREDDCDRIAFLESHGFTSHNILTIHLERSLREPIPQPQLPPGFTLRPLAGEHEVEEYVALHREAFGTNYLTVEARLAFMRGPNYIPELDLIALAPDGMFAALCVCGLDREEDPPHGHTDPVGTRPVFQRRGLARALLLEGLHRLSHYEIETAHLSTGSWNTAMQRAAESVGFRKVYERVWYTKRIEASSG